MTVNIQIDDALIQAALALSNQQSESDVVEQALREYVQRRQQMKILDLFGTIDYDDNYDFDTPRSKDTGILPSP